jgi:hypothetical protein
MSQKSFLLFIFVCFSYFNFSQTDSVEYVSGTPIEDGIYMSYTDFRYNRSISKSLINSKQDKEQLEFIAKILDNEKFSITQDGAEVVYNSKEVWGYFQNNTFYVNYKGDFYRVPVFGSISFLVAYVTVVSPAFYDPRFALTSPATTSKELKEFLMNFYDGVLKEFTTQTAEELLRRDETLFEEYKKRSKKKQKDEIHRFIRRYNQSHPVYFLK